MPPKKSNIVIQDLGDAVNHIAAVVRYLNQHYKYMFKIFVTALTIGLILGFSYLANLQTVKIQKLEPIGYNSITAPFIAIAQTKTVAVQDSMDNLVVRGRKMGKIDKDYAIFKLKDKNILVIINKVTGDAFQMEMPELK